MLVDIVGVALELLEGERRMVVEPLAGGLVQDLVERIIAEFTAFTPFVFCQHLCLWLEPAHSRTDAARSWAA